MTENSTTAEHDRRRRGGEAAAEGPRVRQPLLKADALEVWRGDVCLFEALDFELTVGQTALLVGPNGAGKTTLLRVLAGLAPPTAGRVSWAGADVRTLAPEQRAEIAYRGHIDGLKRELTVDENLQFCRELWGGTASIEALLDEVHLGDKRGLQVRHLSAGQRRRVSLACLRLCNARLWILDEPTTNLDAAGRELVTTWILEHVAAGGIAVVATHLPADLAIAGTLMIEL